MAKISTHINRAIKAMDLAVIYAGDGALHTAAERMAECAEHFKKAAVQKDREIAKMMGNR